jgi:hypothetical protein
VSRIGSTEEDFGEALRRLSLSRFRAKFRLCPKDRLKAEELGAEALAQKASEILSRRLFPAHIPNDGRQTPWKGYPVFTAQHATACCCRGCFEKWWGVPRGRELTDSEKAWAIGLIVRWIERDLAKPAPAEEGGAARKHLARGETGSLFDN